jgi:hypothetical protein
MFDGVLAGLPMLEQPKVHLSWCGPSQESVHWFKWMNSYQPVWPTPPPHPQISLTSLYCRSVRCWFYEFCTRLCSCLTEFLAWKHILATPPGKKVSANLMLNWSSNNELWDPYKEYHHGYIGGGLERCMQGVPRAPLGLLKNVGRQLRQSCSKSSLHTSRRIDKTCSHKSSKSFYRQHTTRVTPNVSTSLPLVTHENVSDMFVDYNKNMKNQMG